MHLALDLLHHGPVRLRVQMPYRRPAVHWVLLLGAVQEMGAAYTIPHFNKGPARALPARREPACHQPARHNPACPIADIFALTGDIGGQGQGKGRVGRGEQPQGPKGGKGKKRQRGREELGSNRTDAQRGGDREEDNDRTGEDDGGYIARETGRRPRPSNQKQRLGRAPQEGRTGGERRRKRGVDWLERGGFGGIRYGGGQDDRGGGRRRKAKR